MRCFFHADDCGLTPDITRDILECIDAGRLQSTSVMPNSPYADEALAALKLRPQTHVAVHLNILEGKALSSSKEIPGLTDKNGFFAVNIPLLWAKLTHYKHKECYALYDAIEEEFRAQIEKVHTALPDIPLHLDGHLHMHAFPPLRRVLDSLLQSYPVRYVRIPSDIRCFLPGSFTFQCGGFIRREMLHFWSRSLRQFLQDRAVTSSSFFISTFASGYMNMPRLEASLRAISPVAQENDLIEIMVHPGGFTPDAKTFSHIRFPGFYTSPNRAIEKEMLLSEELPTLLARYNARLCHPLADPEHIR